MLNNDVLFLEYLRSLSLLLFYTDMKYNKENFQIIILP